MRDPRTHTQVWLTTNIDRFIRALQLFTSVDRFVDSKNLLQHSTIRTRTFSNTYLETNVARNRAHSASTANLDGRAAIRTTCRELMN